MSVFYRNFSWIFYRYLIYLSISLSIFYRHFRLYFIDVNLSFLDGSPFFFHKNFHYPMSWESGIPFLPMRVDSVFWYIYVVQWFCKYTKLYQQFYRMNIYEYIFLIYESTCYRLLRDQLLAGDFATNVKLLQVRYSI